MLKVLRNLPKSRIFLPVGLFALIVLSSSSAFPQCLYSGEPCGWYDQCRFIAGTPPFADDSACIVNCCAFFAGPLESSGCGGSFPGYGAGTFFCGPR
jgi:hypothetical protein